MVFYNALLAFVLMAICYAVGEVATATLEYHPYSHQRPVSIRILDFLP